MLILNTVLKFFLLKYISKARQNLNKQRAPILLNYCSVRIM